MEQDFEAKQKKKKEREALGEWAEDEKGAEEDEEYLVSLLKDSGWGRGYVGRWRLGRYQKRNKRLRGCLIVEL